MVIKVSEKPKKKEKQKKNVNTKNFKKRKYMFSPQILSHLFNLLVTNQFEKDN